MVTDAWYAVCMLSMREGFVVRKSSRLFLPLVGSRTAWWRWKSLVRSSKLVDVLSFSGQVREVQLILGQLKSPAISIFNMRVHAHRYAQ